MYVRKIEYPKWMQNRILEGEAPSADAITNCIRTKANKLSFWKAINEEKINDAVLAIVSHFDHLESCDIIAINDVMIDCSDLHINSSDGVTLYNAFSDNHYDIEKLDYDKLGKIAEIIIESIKMGNRTRFTKKRLKDLLASGINDGKINIDDLKPGVKKYIEG